LGTDVGTHDVTNTYFINWRKQSKASKPKQHKAQQSNTKQASKQVKTERKETERRRDTETSIDRGNELHHIIAIL